MVKMSNKNTCGECSWFSDNRCNLHNNQYIFGDRSACKDFKQKPTNGDKIRQMTNSQLSKFLARISNCNVCFPGNPKGDRKYWYDWTFAPEESEGEDE
jgi:hypothetical protein